MVQAKGELLFFILKKLVHVSVICFLNEYVCKMIAMKFSVTFISNINLNIVYN